MCLVPKAAERAAKIFDQTGRGRVALVMCDDWTGSDYLSNVVVIAAPPVRAETTCRLPD
jgi:hypothetical protein